MSYIRIENFDLYYESHGTGFPLVLISGFASGAWIWYRQIADLSKDFRVITFDPRGVAKSKIPDAATISITAIADDAAHLLDKLNIKKANVLGASFGGTHYVAPAPEVLMAFAATDYLNSSGRVRKFMLPAFTKEFAEANSGEIEKVCALREANRVPENVYLQQLAAATTFDAESRISEIKPETLVLTGDKDLVVPMQNGGNLARTIQLRAVRLCRMKSPIFLRERICRFCRLTV